MAETTEEASDSNSFKPNFPRLMMIVMIEIVVMMIDYDDVVPVAFSALASRPAIVDCKIARFVHQSLSGLALAYLVDSINFVIDSGHRLLRSAADRT